MKFDTVIVWFRNDLRIRDNETLIKALNDSEKIIPVFCFDPRTFEETNLGFPKTGAHRAKFLFQSVEDLQQSIRKLGADLVLFEGKPEELIPNFAKEVEAKAIYFSEEVTSEEIKVEQSLEKNAWSNGIATESFWQSTLYHIDDLPFPVNQVPEVFTQFRKGVEKLSKTRSCLEAPKEIRFPKLDKKYLDLKIPSLEIYGLEEPKSEPRKVMNFIGGESSGLGRIQSYFWKDDLLKEYKNTRNGLIGAAYSSKFSPWLALGCISLRTILEEVKNYEQSRIKNQSTYWLIFELIWRDYFRFICKKHGAAIFQIDGIKKQMDSWRRDSDDFQRWCEGKTGVPFVDANMRELKRSGFMSNRGRQNVASFLVNDLGIDWTWGASYFESQLIDYDVCSNWGNWMYIAGVGNDPRENRYFNILRQGKNYDKTGSYVRIWVPELKALKGFDIHQPAELSTVELKRLKIDLGKTYPHPMVEMEKWV